MNVTPVKSSDQCHFNFKNPIDNIKLITALTAIWCTGDWLMAVNVAWQWNAQGVLSCDDILYFIACREQSLLPNDEKQQRILNTFKAEVNEVKQMWENENE